MKVITPEILWHERDPIYSVDFQPGDWPIQRLASGGVDKIIRIWQMTLDEEGKGKVDFLSNLRRHTSTINVVRFSKNGELLASAGDDSMIIVWKLSDVPAPSNNIFAEDGAIEDKETWVSHKCLRGHLGDVADVSWSKDGRYLVSGSVDNTAIVWDVKKETKLATFSEHHSYVQGVAFDPLGKYVATLCVDRSLRIYNLSSKSCVQNVTKMALPTPPASTTTTTTTESGTTPPPAKPKAFRIFRDDSLCSFFRRLEFSPDGQLLVTPAGCMELGDGKVTNTSFIFARGAFSKPAVYLPSADKTTTVVRMNPQLFELRPVDDSSSSQDTHPEGGEPAVDNRKEWEKHKSMFCLPYRIVFAMTTEDSVLLYDTQQTMPIGLLKNIHYQQINDLSWSSDGKALIVSSTDGFCTIVTFEENELGIPYRKPSAEDSKSETSTTAPEVGSRKSKRLGATDSPLPFSRYSSEETPEKMKDGENKVSLSPNSKETQGTPANKKESVEEKVVDMDTSEVSNTPEKEKVTDKVKSDISSDKKELSEHVEQIKIEDVKSNESKDKDNSSGSEEKSNKSNEDAKETSNSDDPPKKMMMNIKSASGKGKRIQFTTLSLNKKD